MESIAPDRVSSFFEPLDYNLAIASILAGLTPGDFYSDDPEKPVVALLAYNHHLFLAGTPGDGASKQALNRFIGETIFPRLADTGRDVIFLHASHSAWHPHIDEILAGWYPVIRQRTYLECTQLSQDWRKLLKPEFSLHPVDDELLSQSHLEHLDYLKEELCSERPTIEGFLEKSFGFCVLKDEQLAGWCLSEYNTGDRCEVGVATVDAFQRQGLGTVTTLALIEHAFSHGYHRIGWHAWTRNTPSVALALKAGFKKVHDYSIYLCVMNPAIQFALHGDDHRATGAYQEAMTWYRKATEIDAAPAWVFYNAARCLAQLRERKAAFDYLSQAIQRGFDDLDQIRQEVDLVPLHADPAWESLFR